MNPQRGYIGLTDPDWYEFLSGQASVEEVNFWQPHGTRTFRAIKEGDPFFFKLRAPLKGIAGFGYFQRFESLPAWLAWECFGRMNGAPNFEAMVDRIVQLRGDGSSLHGDFQIGCIMIAAPYFFSFDEWIDPPLDWAKTGIQQGKSYSLESGEGKRVFQQCLERAGTGTRSWNVDRVGEASARYGDPVLIRPRLGQGIFKLSVRDAYHRACAVTREHSEPVLEAAHIVPYARGGEHSIDNGLLLRSDLHRLYDLGYVTVTPDHVFQVGDRLRHEFNNGRSYYALSGSRIVVPDRVDWLPNREHLEWHMKEVFKG
jgi:putative restriction endonuclease